MLINANELGSMLQIALSGRDKKLFDDSVLQITERTSDVAIYDYFTDDVYCVPMVKSGTTSKLNFTTSFTEANKIMLYMKALDINTNVVLEQKPCESTSKQISLDQVKLWACEVFIPGSERTVSKALYTAAAQKIEPNEEDGKFVSWKRGAEYMHKHTDCVNSVMVETKNGVQIGVLQAAAEIPRREGLSAAFVLTEQLLKELAAVTIHCSKDEYRPIQLNPFVCDGYLYATDSLSAAKVPIDIEGTYVIPQSILDSRYIDCKVIYTKNKVFLQKHDFLKTFELIDISTSQIANLAQNIDNLIKEETPSFTEIERSRFSLGTKISRIMETKLVVIRVGKNNEGTIREVMCENADLGMEGRTELTQETQSEANFVFGFSTEIAERILRCAVGETVLLSHMGKATRPFKIEFNCKQFLFMPVRLPDDYSIEGNITETNVAEKTGWRTMQEYWNAGKRTFDKYHLDTLSDKFMVTIEQRIADLQFYNLAAVREHEVAVQQIDELQAQQTALSESKAGKTAKEIKAIDKEIAAIEKQLAKIVIPQSYPTLEFCTEHNETNETERRKLQQLLSEFQDNPCAFINVPTLAEYYSESEEIAYSEMDKEFEEEAYS